ncbi:MAG: DsbA family protein [Sulfuricaulis sp.]|nr:DsbA family protein [Sulfuricaulis sp.]
MSPPRVLWYFADPMCSWCWGFSPVIGAIKETYSERIKIALMLGGLRPGTTDPMTPKSRAEILHHWRDVREMTGQAFAFEGALPEGFVYDTEPPSRAVIAVADLNPEAIFPYFKSVQEAFYTKQQDITQAQTLAALAEGHGIDTQKFLERFGSEDMKNKTRTHFQVAREAGVRGFPTIVLQAESGGTLLTHGYRSFDQLKPEIENWLAGPP